MSVKVELNKYEQAELYSNPYLNRNNYLDSLLRRFKQQVRNARIMEECQKREYFLKKSLRRKEKDKAAMIRRIQEEKNYKKYSHGGSQYGKEQQ